MCTTLVVTAGASDDGSTMVAHSDDDELGDQTIIRVPAANHPAGAVREVFAEHYRHPRVATDERGPGYRRIDPTPDWAVPLGHIPQVAHTFAYFDGNYGIVNEHGLMMGECTDGARFEPLPTSVDQAARTGGPSRLFYSQELSRVALERCTGAREAVELMGALLDEYGYYSTGETLLVADGHEAWVFEMCALPDAEHHSAWVAQRVVDGEVFVAANEFRIREVRTDVGGDRQAVPVPEPEQLFSAHLVPGLRRVGWWDPAEGPLDWLRAVSVGEYAHPYYSLRRVWRVLDLVNPDLGLNPWVTRGFDDPADGGYATDYPFSVAPARPLGVADVLALYRDHYEGTEFDLTQGVAAGPYGDPHRFVGPYDAQQNDVSSTMQLTGAWERALSVHYQGYIFVTQWRPDAPAATRGVCWFAPDVAYTSCATPLPIGMSRLPASYERGGTQAFDRGSAWWAFDLVANWSRLNFQRMTRADILPLQREWEQRGRVSLADWDRRCASLEPEAALLFVTGAAVEHADRLVEAWWSLAERLFAKYSDGYVNPPGQAGARGVGYPANWLRHTDYVHGPTAYGMPAANR